MTGKISTIPNPRRSAREALSSVGIIVGVVGVALALAESLVERKSRRTALTLLSIFIVVVILRTALALLSSFVPKLGLLAAHAGLIYCEEGFVVGADALPGVGVKDKALRAGEADLGLGVPLAWEWAIHAFSLGINVVESGRTFALFGERIFYLVEGAITSLSCGVVDARSNTVTGA